MTVKQLKEVLETVPDDHAVILSRDSEGNGFSPLSECSEANYRPDNTYSGEISDEGRNCVVLWPTN